MKHVAALCLLVTACESAQPDKPRETTSARPASASARTSVGPVASPASSAPAVSASASSSASPIPVRGTAFVRHPPHSGNSNADWVDECTQTGGNYFSCSGALREAQEAKQDVYRRYLWRISQAYSPGEKTYRGGGSGMEDGPPHAEVPYMCDVSKPCGASVDGQTWNAAVNCLARAQIETSAAKARAAHAHACKCDPKGGLVPGYNHTPFICDENGKPAFIAPDMSADEAKDILDCAICHPKRGAKACERDIGRLSTTDKDLATFIEQKQIPRCQTPNEGPREWMDGD